MDPVDEPERSTRFATRAFWTGEPGDEPVVRPVEPSWSGALREEVERAFEITGAATPGWPDPHPDRAPLEEEYSRVLDPGKYAILPARIDAWAATLTARGLGDEVTDGIGPWAEPLRVPVVAPRSLVPRRSGALTLVIASTMVDDQPCGLLVGVSLGDGPVAQVALLPDCGCDACDSGSERLVDELDEKVLTVLRGGRLALRADDGTSATRSWSGSSASGPSGRELMELFGDDVPALPPHVRAWAGTPWLT